jgi:hypothetical protein
MTSEKRCLTNMRDGYTYSISSVNLVGPVIGLTRVNLAELAGQMIHGGGINVPVRVDGVGLSMSLGLLWCRAISHWQPNAHYCAHPCQHFRGRGNSSGSGGGTWRPSATLVHIAGTHADPHLMAVSKDGWTRTTEVLWAPCPRKGDRPCMQHSWSATRGYA